PNAPAQVHVLVRSLVAHHRYDILPTTPLDVVMQPPIPPYIDVTDFDRHTDIFNASYLCAREAIAALEAEGNSALDAILSAGRPTTRRPRPAVVLPSKVLTN